MSFQAIKCLSCQRDIQIPIDIPNPSCPYCGTAVGQEGAAPAATISSLMGMAKTAELAGNNAEALAYFNRVLEADPTNSEAWIGKGKSAGWQTTLSDIRISEMLVAFSHAIATSDSEAKNNTLESVTAEANILIVTIYKMARDHMLEYVSLHNSWSIYLGQMSQMVDALTTVNGWNPEDRVTLENIVHLCKDNIEGVSYRDQYDGHTPKAWTLSPEYEAVLKLKLESATSQLRNIDPEYAPPVIEKKKAEDCFVITATMGDPSHPDVRILQAFRDEWLRQRGWGAGLIALYYRIGPSIATFIARSDVRRKMSYRLIVRPAVFLTRVLNLRR